MASRACRLVGGLSGASAVGLAAYGAHKMPGSDHKTAFDNANKFHLVNSAVLLAAPNFGKRAAVSGSLLAAGTALFCGSCYAVALADEPSYGKLAPAGGFVMIAAYLAIALL